MDDDVVAGVGAEQAHPAVGVDHRTRPVTTTTHSPTAPTPS